MQIQITKTSITKETNKPSPSIIWSIRTLLKIFFINVLIFFLILELTFSVFGWGTKWIASKNNDSSAMSSKVFKIMILGESTSYGVYLKNRLNDAYPYLVASLLSNSRKETEFRVINLSYPGQVSDSILNLFNHHFFKDKPDLVICHFGVNDTSYALNPFLQMKIFGTSAPRFLQNIKTIKFIMLASLYLKNHNKISRTDEGGFIFHDKHLVNSKSTPDYLVNTQNNYQHILDSIKEHNIPYLMISYFDAPEEVYEMLENIQRINKGHYLNLNVQKFFIGKDIYAEDMWHPNSKGHLLIADRVVELINSDTHYFLKE